MILAGIDIGTLTCRLLIAHLSSDGQLTELHAERRLLRLGEGVDRHHLLHPAAMARAVETLKAWRHIIDAYHVDREIAVATSAVRDANNRKEFLALIKREAAFSVKILSGEEEARRTLLGIRSGLPSGIEHVLALDIGGGSTECIVDRPGESPIVRSFDIGAVRLTERCLTHDPPTPPEVEAAKDLVRASMDKVKPILQHLDGTVCVGTAGTITTIAAMVQRLQTLDHAHIHLYRLNVQDIVRLERELLSITSGERRGMPGLESGREGVIVAGVIILRTAMSSLGLSNCLVSDYGLREGVLLDVAKRVRHDGPSNSTDCSVVGAPVHEP
ncbi:MAG TPA: Ppx/GppA phosphatase family protein [Nitrospiraceae bacterium]|nr:Ppx/GppA phosphatase family protein [Nitrospiraceae bacterium]